MTAKSNPLYRDSTILSLEASVQGSFIIMDLINRSPHQLLNMFVWFRTAKTGEKRRILIRNQRNTFAMKPYGEQVLFFPLERNNERIPSPLSPTKFEYFVHFEDGDGDSTIHPGNLLLRDCPDLSLLGEVSDLRAWECMYLMKSEKYGYRSLAGVMEGTAALLRMYPETLTLSGSEDPLRTVPVRDQNNHQGHIRYAHLSPVFVLEIDTGDREVRVYYEPSPLGDRLREDFGECVLERVSGIPERTKNRLYFELGIVLNEVGNCLNFVSVSAGDELLELSAYIGKSLAEAKEMLGELNVPRIEKDIDRILRDLSGGEKIDPDRLREKIEGIKTKMNAEMALPESRNPVEEKNP